MWGIDPRKMCDQHLLGEHKEMHQVVGHIDTGNIEVVKGHAERRQLDTSLIQRRHEELVEEMKRRGFNHESPMEYEDRLDLGSIDVGENREELFARCAKCRSRASRGQVSGW